ncbi:LOW QUALITY PROTEIN: caspase-8-like [Discoglossus pictus]
MHFKAEVHNNLDREQILQTVRSYSRQDHKGMDCFICCILSHGDKGVIYGTNGQTVQISALTSCFKKDQCPLAGKPSFFIQACQGQNNHEPVQLQVDAHKAPNDHGVSDDEFIPNEPDFLLGMATTLNYVSYRHPVKGSLYIQSLCHHLVHCREEDVLSILTKVNNDVSQTNVKWKCWKQMPQPCSSLTKKLIFPMN